MRHRIIMLTVLGVFGIMLQTASAAPVLFMNGDAGVGPGGARPNSDAAHASFNSAASSLGTVNVIDFEDMPVGYFTNMTVAPGVDVVLTNVDVGDPVIDNNDDIIIGYNTTAGGTKHLHVDPSIANASATFNFATHIQAFGAYLTGLGTSSGNLHVLFDDGSSQDIEVAGYSYGGVQYFGFTSAGSSIVSVEILLQEGSGDIFGIDDVSFVAVPEPATMSLLALGGLLLRRRK